MTSLTSAPSYQQSLIQAGLSDEQALIYEYLVKNGPQTAGKVSISTPLKRGLVYKILDSLVENGLAIKHDAPGKVAIFEPAHPLKLRELAEKKEADAKNAQEALKGVLEKMTIDYNLISGRPGVKFYEGKERIKELIFDSLNAKTEILTLADVTAVEKYIKDIDEEYVKLRNKKGLAKRLLVLDTPEAHGMEGRPEHFTATTKYCKLEISPFSTAMMLYDEKVVFLTLTEKYIIGFLIEDKFIYSTQKALFDFIWNKA